MSKDIVKYSKEGTGVPGESHIHRADVTRGDRTETGLDWNSDSKAKEKAEAKFKD